MLIPALLPGRKWSNKMWSCVESSRSISKPVSCKIGAVSKFKILLFASNFLQFKNKTKTTLYLFYFVFNLMSGFCAHRVTVPVIVVAQYLCNN